MSVQTLEREARGIRQRRIPVESTEETAGPVLLGEAANPEEFAKFAPRLSFTDGTSLFRSLEGLRIGRSGPSS